MTTGNYGLRPLSVLFNGKEIPVNFLTTIGDEEIERLGSQKSFPIEKVRCVTVLLRDGSKGLFFALLSDEEHNNLEEREKYPKGDLPLFYKNLDDASLRGNTVIVDIKTWKLKSPIEEAQLNLKGEPDYQVIIRPAVGDSLERFPGMD